MIQIKRVSFSKLKKDWDILYNGMSDAYFPYMSYSYAEIINSAYRKNRMWRDRPIFYCGYLNGRIIMIAPLRIHLGKKGLRIMSFGSPWRIVGENFLFDCNTSSDIKRQCLDLLFSKFHHGFLDFISDNSYLYSYLSSNCRFSPERDEPMVKIRLPSTYDEYCSSLSKEKRQNLRTMYNRLISDNVDFSFEMYYGHSVPQIDYNAFLDLYCDSCFGRWSTNQKYTPQADLYLRKGHPNAVAINLIDSSICAIVKINGTVAAGCCGFVSRDGQYFTVPRLAFSDRFKRYSPGQLCLIEMIKHMISQHMSEFDLSKGREKYKYELGGIEYDQFCFSF